MLYDLFFAFVQTDRYREARKIIEVKTHNKEQWDPGCDLIEGALFFSDVADLLFFYQF